MAQVIVRNLDERVVETLRLRAELHGNSLEQELRNLLSEAAKSTAEERVALADRIRALTPNVSQTDSTSIIRDQRDER